MLRIGCFLVGTFKIGWFSTGRDQAACDLLTSVYEKIQNKEIPRSAISYVFCNREVGESEESDKFLGLVVSLGIPLVTVSSAKFDPELRKDNLSLWRARYYAKVRDSLKRFNDDIRVLAGYMLILDSETCAEKPSINLHPALPGGPQGTWQEVIWQLIENKRHESGVMVHLVTPELDRGPALTFCRYPVWIPWKTDDLWRAVDLYKDDASKERLFWAIRKEGLRREIPLLIATLKLLAEGKIRIAKGEIRDQNNQIKEGIDLTP